MKRTASKVFTVADARARAEKILPPVLFNYIDGGASDEISLRENRRAYEDVAFRPRAAAAPPSPELSVKVLGADLSLPVVLAPVGGLRLFYPDGDRVAMRAAGTSGTAAILSTASGTSLEDVFAVASGPAWFQLYFRGGREGAEFIVDSAQRAGYGALFVTLDVGAGGIQTERIRKDVDQLARLRGEIVRDSVIPIGLNVRNAIVFAPQLVRRPRWTYGYVRDGVPTKFASLDDKETSQLPEGKDLVEDTRKRTTVDEVAGGRKPQYKTPMWDDMVWIRELWRGPLVAKGVLTPEDACRAVDLGCDAVLVSNHGGRQLDGAMATLRALPGIREAVGPSITVLIDGGIRRGSDVVKAIALGADATVIGRAYAYGLAAAGEPGVRRVLDLFRQEITQTMKSLGRTSIADIDGSAIDTSRFVLPTVG